MADEPLLTGAALAAAADFDVELPDAVVLVFDESLMPRRKRKDSHRHPFRRVTRVNDEVAMVCAIGPGAPSAAVAVEFLAAVGVKTVIAVGTAGDLTGALPTAMHAVIAAESDDGTSRHYGDDRSAHAAITSLLVEAAGRAAITALTTDVPFRHTPQRLEQHRSRADVVEMECAAVFAAAHTFKMRAGAVVVVSDHFKTDTWEMRDQVRVRQGLEEAVAAAIEAASR